MIDKIKEKISQFSENGIISNMRVNFTIITWSAAFVFFAVGVYIIVFSITGVEITQWIGMGTFLVGIASALLAVFSEKRKQKKIEKDKHNENI